MKSESRLTARVLSHWELSINLIKKINRKIMGIQRLHAGVQNEYGSVLFIPRGNESDGTIKQIGGVLNFIHSYFLFHLWRPCAPFSFTYTITTH